MTNPHSRKRVAACGMRKGEVLRVAALLRAEGREEETEVSMEEAEDGRTMEADAMVLMLAPDEALVVNVS